jgi:uncharacterized protein YjbJ (UPF0337 family)
MNDKQFEGKWDQIKGQVKREFGKLTDDDVREVKGRRQNLVGKIKERYGDAKEEALDRLNGLLRKLDA